MKSPRRPRIRIDLHPDGFGSRRPRVSRSRQQKPPIPERYSDVQPQILKYNGLVPTLTHFFSYCDIYNFIFNVIRNKSLSGII